MAVETSVSKMHSGRMILLAILCLVFGLWGLYDYVITIPNQARKAELKQVVGLVQQALTSQDPDLQRESLAAIGLEVQRMQERLSEIDASLSENPGSPEEVREQLSIEAQGDIFVFRLLIASAVVLENREVDPTLTRNVNEQIDQLVKDLDEVNAPGKFDSAVQWLFILCLPFAFYFLWQWFLIKGNKYVLEDDGSLQTPEGRFEAAEIVDIDMSRWMAKSIATVVLADGQLIKLDAYIHTRLDQIVGILAHKFHPDQWTEEAKPVKPPEKAEDANAKEQASENSSKT